MSQPQLSTVPEVTPTLPPPPPLLEQSISETTAIRLFNSVVATERANGNGSEAQAMRTNLSIESVHSANEFGNSCRICRWNRSDMQILRCPCQCKGSVGYIHLSCLKRWILQRRNHHCEICNSPFEMPKEKLDIRRMFRSFFSTKCCGRIIKNLLFCFSLMPLANIVLQQVLLCMDNINQSPHDNISAGEVFLASFALLTSSALFFQYFEYVTTRVFVIRNIIRHWWMFGGSSDFDLIDCETDAEFL